MKSLRLMGLLTVGAALLFASQASAAFSIPGFITSSTTSLAGAHPDLTTDLTFSTSPNGAPPSLLPDGNVRSLSVNFPPGFVGNPNAIPQCSQIDFVQRVCPPETQVGSVDLTLLLPNGFPFSSTLPVFNMQPRNSGETAELAFSFVGFLTIHLPIAVRTDGDYGISAIDTGVSHAYTVARAAVTVWGVPGNPSHDPLRQNMHLEPVSGVFNRAPFFTNPTRCGVPLEFSANADSYQDPATTVEARASLPQLTNCNELEFGPQLKARPTTSAADSPSGLDVDLHLPQNEEPDGRATAQLRDAEVTLPEGLVVNPSSANGLGACTPEEIGLTTAVGEPQPHFSLASPSCPDASRLGSVEVDTPVLEGPLKGSVYLASPHQNPFGSLLALYLVVEGHGLVVKLPGNLSADPRTGRLTAVFDEDPQLPFEDLKLELFSGAFAPLRTPATCGTYATTSVMTPWSAPDSGPPARPKDEYEITRGPGGQACSAPTNSPSFEAGSTTPIAGANSPFVLDLSRPDGSQELSSVTVEPPPGLLARLAGVPYCPDAALATAAGRSGASEQSSPSCPAASQVGTVAVAAGAGPRPFNAPGKVYLAGPYKGAPLSLAVIAPAEAGPFDLGTVVVRNALFVNTETTEVTAVSDPIPSVLQGIPLDIRSIQLKLDRPSFTVNPTSCDPTAVTGSAVSLLLQSAPLTSRFQVGECGRLGFSPKLKLSLAGPTRRTGNPAVRAVLTAPEGQANFAATTVILPRGEFIDQSHINGPCTRVQFDQGAGDGSACPPGSILGTAVAYSPLLEKPLEGPVYFRSNGGERKLPDLVASLGGQIHVNLVGFIDSVKIGKEGSRVRTRFASVPDAPVSRFELRLKGGKRGLIENSEDLCEVKPVANVQMTAQNGKVADFRQKIGTSCKKKARKHRAGAKSKDGGGKGRRG
jgi:hypothetical protein